MNIALGPVAGEVVPSDEMDFSLCPKAVHWVPRWLVDCGKRCEVGITIDDHCFVVLAKDWSGKWGPTSHIPPVVAQRLSELADTEL